jgi:hypothetical protein
LHNALTAEDTRAGAAEALRALIDDIRVAPEIEGNAVEIVGETRRAAAAGIGDQRRRFLGGSGAFDKVGYGDPQPPLPNNAARAALGSWWKAPPLIVDAVGRDRAVDSLSAGPRFEPWASTNKINDLGIDRAAIAAARFELGPRRVP